MEITLVFKNSFFASKYLKILGSEAISSHLSPKIKVKGSRCPRGG
jgi:hypothetical protein